MKTNENIIHLSNSYLHITYEGKKLRIPLSEVLKSSKFTREYLPKAVRRCLAKSTTVLIDGYEKSHDIWADTPLKENV